MQEIEYDLSTKSVFHSRQLYRRRSLFGRLRPYISGIEPDVRLTASISEYYPQYTYNEKSKRDFLSGFIHFNTEAREVVDNISKCRENGKHSKLIGELFLLPFCEMIIDEHLKNGSISKDQVDTLAKHFCENIEKGLEIKLQIGLDGLIIDKELLLDLNDNETIILRSPKLEDLSESMILSENWDGDYRNHPWVPIPTVSSIAEISLKRIELVPVNDTIFEQGIISYDRNVDWLVHLCLQKAQQLHDHLALFQSTALPLFQYIKFWLGLKNLTKEGAQYIVEVPVKKDEFIDNRCFNLTQNQGEHFRRFADYMIKINMYERIYGKLNEGSINEHTARPIEIAYRRYFEIISSRKDEQAKIKDTIEALEGFFVPERHFTREFIQKVVNQYELLGIDPNDTAKILADGYRIRSSFTHQGQGWTDDKLPRIPETPIEEMKSIRRSYEHKRQKWVALLTLAYLRTSIVARILSGVPDTDYIKLLATPEGIKQLKMLLRDQESIVSGCGIEKTELKEDVCSDCGEFFPSYALDLHRKVECNEMKNVNKKRKMTARKNDKN